MIGVVAGSFDPITKGHLWLIKKGAEMVGEDGTLYVVMGVNADKKYYFSEDERKEQIRKVLSNNLPNSLYNGVVIVSIRNDLLINFAKEIGARYIFRGIRNIKDFEYEMDIQRVNRKICSAIETVFFVPPPEYTEVSSSTIKGIVGFNNWQEAVEDYVDPFIVSEFKRKIDAKK